MSGRIARPIFMALLVRALLFVWCLTDVPLCGAETESAAVSAAKPPLPACSEAAINAFLGELAGQGMTFPERIRAIAASYAGAPYVRTPLRDETADWFPYRTVDCTMFVLCVTAFANSSTVQEARRHMRLLHYRDGIVGYTTRYHFTEDRVTDPANRYFTAITEQCVRDPQSLRRVTLSLNRRGDGSYLFGERLADWSRTVTIAYVPRRGFRMALLGDVPPVCGIALVKWPDAGQGLLIGHEGLLIDGDLYHASPGTGVCVISRYLAREFPRSSWHGFLLFSINEAPDQGHPRVQPPMPPDQSARLSDPEHHCAPSPIPAPAACPVSD